MNRLTMNIILYRNILYFCAIKGKSTRYELALEKERYFCSVAQLIRATVFQTVSCGSESHLNTQYCKIKQRLSSGLAAVMVKQCLQIFFASNLIMQLKNNLIRKYGLFNY